MAVVSTFNFGGIMLEILEKLKREWKTFAVAALSAVVFGYDALVANGIDYMPLIPDDYKKYAAFAIPVVMLTLRRYK